MYIKFHTTYKYRLRQTELQGVIHLIIYIIYVYTDDERTNVKEKKTVNINPKY